MTRDGAAEDGKLGAKPESAELSSITSVPWAPLCGHPASSLRAEVGGRRHRREYPGLPELSLSLSHPDPFMAALSSAE